MSNKEYYHITDNPLKLMYDAEAISYDEVIVRVLPQIYRLIQSNNPS